MGRLSEEAIAPPPTSWWTLSEVEEYLLGRARGALSEAEREEESPCWWILSALDYCDGKEAREAYYAGL